jgi:aminopeptidase
MAGRDFAEATRRLAELVVGFGANVQPGQVVSVTSYVGKEALTREVTRAAYQRGARWVDVVYFDQWLKRERVAHAPEDSLDFVPPWLLERLRWVSAEHGARISLSGPHAPTALDGLDPRRAGRDLLPYLPLTGEVVNARTTNWTVSPAPTPDWAAAVYPDTPRDEAFERLWDAIIHVCRLDADDPAAAWDERMGALGDVAQRLTEPRFDRIHLRGPGTDLTVGLFPSSRWLAAGFETVDGVRHYPNVPSEEVFTTPDPSRADGHVTATIPLELYGSMISGIRVEFEGGRAVKIDADQGADALRSAAAKDDGASRLGELALVDGQGRIGPLGTVFYDTLLDENAASHVALGNGYELGVEDEDDIARVNPSVIHVDFMIGRPELEVDGLTAAGERVPLLRDGDWQL